mmetsp:Transcript_16880/g.22726  ORF Transcript_16880/g.22726 Transcript_16880/m.22726 type:complete len:501 (-) Transcript_16880:137-1639(-)
MASALDTEYGDMVAGMQQVFATGKTRKLEWRREQLEQIHKMVSENHEAITAAVREDLGGSKMRGLGELQAASAADHALDHLDLWTSEKWASGWLHRLYVRPEPKGVVLIIAPWNFPFTLSLGPLVPAIAAGNLVVIKPSEVSPTCSNTMKTLVQKYLDPECVKVVEGAVPETTALLNQRWDHIFYTGNGTIGKIVMQAAAENLTPVTLELGGKSPVIIDETAQMDATCDRIAMAKWLNCGQICVAPDYVLVHESKAEEFVERSAALVKKCYGDDPRSNEEWGKLVSPSHVDRVRMLIETSKGKIVCGGVDGIDKSARHVPPTIIKEPSLSSPIMQEEIFGPVLPVLPYKDLHDALSMVKQKETPLAMYVYSQDSRNIEKVLTEVPSGGCSVNSSLEHILGEDAPFGGKGPSGIGSYHGKYGFDEFSHMRSVLQKSTLPGMRGTAFPLPSAKSPTPDFVYGIAAKASLGFLPRPLKRQLRKRYVKLAMLVILARLGLTLFL